MSKSSMSRPTITIAYNNELFRQIYSICVEFSLFSLIYRCHLGTKVTEIIHVSVSPVLREILLQMRLWCRANIRFDLVLSINVSYTPDIWILKSFKRKKICLCPILIGLAFINLRFLGILLFTSAFRIKFQIDIYSSTTFILVFLRSRHNQPYNFLPDSHM